MGAGESDGRILIHGGSNVKQLKPVVVYVDGSGADPNGISGCAWLRDDIQKHVDWGRGWTNNEAEYRAVLAAVQAVPKGLHAEILCDSALVVRQLRDEYDTREPRLCDLRAQIDRVISSRGLHITWQWIPRRENKADKLLRRRPAEIQPQRRQLASRRHRGAGDGD
jgi:ribonuclease HI